MTLLEYGQDIIIIDMGLQFPEEDMPGIDYIIPNVDYLKGKEANIRGVIITHAHYDHIGGVPHLMSRLGNPPIYSSDLTIKIIEKRQQDFSDSPRLNSQIVTTDSEIKLGSFSVKFFGVSHNVPTSMGLIITTPLGIVVHTGDFKLDLNVSGDTPAEIGKIAKLADKKFWLCSPIRLTRRNPVINCRKWNTKLIWMKSSATLPVELLSAPSPLCWQNSTNCLGGGKIR
jgi:ribonuclease J